jgi:hypothetical protein
MGGFRPVNKATRLKFGSFAQNGHIFTYGAMCGWAVSVLKEQVT